VACSAGESTLKYFACGRSLALLVAIGASLIAAQSAGASTPRPLITSVSDPRLLLGPGAAVGFNRIHGAGATVVRLVVNWRSVAPAVLPQQFDATSPSDPGYDWSTVDPQVTGAVAAGLTPLLIVDDAPTWAQASGRQTGAGPYKPSPKAFGDFAQAIATRFDGTFEGLPRVRYWSAWNEPNLTPFLSPQLVGTRPFSPTWYRSMLNAFADSVHGVHADNLVIAGELAPFRDITPVVLKRTKDWGPLTFMRNMLCLSKSLKPTCHSRSTFDVWATHPYTSGGPTHHAVLPDDVSLADLPKMRATLDAAIRAGNVQTTHHVQFWATEFSWDSSPPDPEGVPTSLLTRWTAEALYRMWAAGITLVSWFRLYDDPITTSYLQCGLYYWDPKVPKASPKPILRAFRFPVVAIPQGQGVYVWGRTPGGVPGRVRIEWSGGHGGWRLLRTMSTNRYGIFESTFAIAPTGLVHARLVTGGLTSAAFGVPPVADRFFNPFGQTTLVEPKHGP